ncbi:MAG: bestrophin family ion channel [Bacteroidia bacterium]
MILKRNFNPLKVIQYVKTELMVSVLLSLSVFLLYSNNLLKIQLPFAIAAILGSALAIFIAFRNNSSYSRWWEARTIWGSIINNSRIFARQIIANADNAVAAGKISTDQAAQFKKDVIYRQIAFAHALRIYLRKQQTHQEYQHLLNPGEFNAVIAKNNYPNELLLTQGLQIKDGIRKEILGAFDNISLEPTLAGFNNFQGACERIKNTPLLRQYDFFTRLFLYVFMLVLPFAIAADFDKLNISYLMIPVSVLVSFVFATIGKVGEVNEDPFENKITDIPMTAMCITIERDLKEMLGETELPAKAEPYKGFLY